MSTNAFELFGEVGVNLSSFDKAMDAADARLGETAASMQKTGQASDRMAARINAAGQNIHRLREAARAAEAEARKLGDAGQADAQKFSQLITKLNGLDASLTKSAKGMKEGTTSGKELSREVFGLEQKVKSCARALGDEAGALKKSGDAADDAEKKHTRLADRVSKIAGGLQSVGTALTATVTLPLLGLGAAATKTAGEVQSSVANISTIKPEIDTGSLYKQLNDLQTKVPYTAGQLGEALYDIFGTIDVDQNGGVRLLEKFSKGATAARTDANVFGSAMMGMMGAFGKGVEDADSVMDVFFNTVNRASNMTGAQLAPNLGKVSAMASKAGVSLEEMGALLVASTKGGGVAEENINNIANLLQKLPLPETRKQLKALFNGQDITVDAQGKFRPILDVMADLKQRMSGLSEGDRAAALGKIFPDAQAQLGAENVMKFIDDAYRALDENSTKTDSTVKAWEKMSATLGVQAQLLKNSILNALGQLGERLLPAIQPVVSWLAEKIPAAVSYLISLWDRLPAAMQGGLAGFTGLVAILGPVAVAIGAVAAGIAAVGGTVTLVLVGLVAQIALVGASIAAAAVTAYKLWKENFGGLRDYTEKVWSALRAGVTAFVSFFTDLWAQYGEEIKSTFSEYWSAIAALLEPILSRIISAVSAAFDRVVSVTKAVWPFVKTMVEVGLRNVLAVVRALTAILNGDWAKAWEQFGVIADNIRQTLARLGVMILNALRAIAVAAYQASIQIGARIVAGIIAGVVSTNPAMLLTTAIVSAISRSSASARSYARAAGSSVGRAYSEGLASGSAGIDAKANLGGGGGGGSKVDPLTALPPGFGGGGGGKKGGSGKSLAEQMAEAAVKGAELDLRAASRMHGEAMNMIKSLREFRKLSIKDAAEWEIGEEERLLQKKLAVIAKQREAAKLIKNKSERGLRNRELDEDEKDARSDFKKNKKQKEDDVAKAGEERQRALAQLSFDILQENEREKLKVIQSAGEQRIATAESIARRVGEIELRMIDNEVSYLNRQLTEAGKDEKERTAIQMRLGMLEQRRANQVAENNRQVSEARRKDLEDYRSYSESLRDLVNQNLEDQLDLKRMELDMFRRFGGDKGRALKLEIEIDLEAEDQRHRRAKETIERERREFEERKHTREQWEQFLREHNKKVETEEERHRREQAAIRAKEIETLIGKLRAVADRATDIIGRAIDEGVKGGFKAAFRSILQDFAQLLRDLALQLLKSYFLKLLMNVLNVKAPNAQGQGGSTGNAGTGSWKDILGGIFGGIFGGGRNSDSNASPGNSTTDAVNNQGERQRQATEQGTGGTTQQVETQGERSGNLLNGILGNGQNMLGVLNSMAAGIQTPGWARFAQLAIGGAQAFLNSRSGESGGGGGSSGGGTNGGNTATLHRAGGGSVFGPGTSVSDSIPALLSNGEYVINARTVSRFGRRFFDRLNFGGKIPMRFAAGGYASGGPVVTSSSGPGGSVIVNMNIHTPDAGSFRQSMGNMTREMAEHLQRQRARLG